MEEKKKSHFELQGIDYIMNYIQHFKIPIPQQEVGKEMQYLGQDVLMSKKEKKKNTTEKLNKRIKKNPF